MQTDTRSISQINPKSLVSQGDQVVDPINRLVDTVPFVQHWCHINTTKIPKVSNYSWQQCNETVGIFTQVQPRLAPCRSCLILGQCPPSSSRFWLQGRIVIFVCPSVLCDYLLMLESWKPNLFNFQVQNPKECKERDTVVFAGFPHLILITSENCQTFCVSEHCFFWKRFVDPWSPRTSTHWADSLASPLCPKNLGRRVAPETQGCNKRKISIWTDSNQFKTTDSSNSENDFEGTGIICWRLLLLLWQS